MKNQLEPLPQVEEDLMPYILKIVPSFKKRWSKYVRENEKHLAKMDDDDKDYYKPGIYIDIGEFSHFLVVSYEKKRTSWFPTFFDFIERMIVEGNEKMKELAVIGFLEDIQTISSWRPHKGKGLLKWLCPKSKEAWVELDKLWSKYGSLPNIIRAGY
jgi:hypothetical protein